MTTKQRSSALRFLLEDFIDVPDGPVREAGVKGLSALRRRAVRLLIPGPIKGALSLQQAGLLALQPDAFQQLRRDVRYWLRSVVTSSTVGHRVTIKGPLALWLVAKTSTPERLQAPIVEGDAVDVFWFHLVYLVSRVGLSRIGVCKAPKSKRDPGQRQLSGEAEPCERLFIRRGEAKEFCSERCQTRVATQRARTWKGPEKGKGR
jgi:hypothetical protein